MSKYISIQNRYGLRTSFEQNVEQNIYNVTQGLAYEVNEDNLRIHYSSNNMNESIINKFELNEFEQDVHMFLKTGNYFGKVKYSRDFYKNIVAIMSRASYIHNFQCILMFDGQEDLFFGKGCIQKQSICRYGYADVTFLLSTLAGDIMIKRQFILDIENDIEMQLYNFLEKMIADYSTYYANDESVDIENSDLILPAGRGGILIHEIVGHMLEADNFFLSNQMGIHDVGSKVADGNVSVSDSCTKRDVISYDYSSDGFEPKTVELIKGGVISGLMTDECTAHRFGLPNSGNGRSSSYENVVIPRMRNTYVHNGKEKKEDIIRETKNGVYVLDMGGGRVDLNSGVFVFSVYSGYKIEEGEIKGMVSPFIYSGNVWDVLRRIDMVGDDLEYQFGICEKNGQSIPVSYGQPTLRVKSIK